MDYRTERFDFENGRGQTLAAMLERPAEATKKEQDDYNYRSY